MNTALLDAPVVTEQAIADTATSLLLQLESSHSQRCYAGDIRIFLDWLAGAYLSLTEISEDDMYRYYQHLRATYASATAERRFVVARRFLGVAVKKKFLDANPAQDIKVKAKRSDCSPYAALSKHEARALLQSVERSTPRGKCDYAILMVLIFAGLRRSECAAIRLNDITRKQERYVLRVQHGKGNKPREVPLRQDVFAAIRAYLQAVDRLNDNPESYLSQGFLPHSGAHLCDRQIGEVVKKYAKKTGITATAHDLRATFCTLSIDTGAPLILTQRLMGHASPSTTERYYTRKRSLDGSPVYAISLV